MWSNARNNTALFCSCSLLCIWNSDWVTENEAGRSVSVNGNEEPAGEICHQYSSVVTAIIPYLHTIKLQYILLGDYWEFVRPARHPVLTWVPSSVPPGNNIQDTFLIGSATDTSHPNTHDSCITDTVATELRYVSKQDVTTCRRLPLGQLQNSNLWAKSPDSRCCIRCTSYGYMPSACSVLHTLVWGTFRVLARGLRSIIWTMLSSSLTLINLALGCNANGGKCTRISQWRRHSSGWYSMVRKKSLVFNCDRNCIAVTKTIHMNHICILCKWTRKWHSERNQMHGEQNRNGTNMRCSVCRFYFPRLSETAVVLCKLRRPTCWLAG